MAKSWFANNPLLAYPIAALTIFMFVFMVVALRTVLTKKSAYEKISRLPLESAGDSRE